MVKALLFSLISCTFFRNYLQFHLHPQMNIPSPHHRHQHRTNTITTIATSTQPEGHIQYRSPIEESTRREEGKKEEEEVEREGMREETAKGIGEE